MFLCATPAEEHKPATLRRLVCAKAYVCASDIQRTTLAQEYLGVPESILGNICFIQIQSYKYVRGV